MEDILRRWRNGSGMVDAIATTIRAATTRAHNAGTTPRRIATLRTIALDVATEIIYVYAMMLAERDDEPESQP